MHIVDALDKNCIKLNLTSSNKKDAVSEILEILQKNEFIEDEKTVLKQIFEREEMMSTGIGKGIGVPHCKTDLVDNIVLAVGRNKSGISDYETLDDEPVKLIFVLITNIDKNDEHINMLARISRIVKLDYVRNSLLRATSKKKFYDIVKNEDKKFL